jgi:hypothetical protein
MKRLLAIPFLLGAIMLIMLALPVPLPVPSTPLPNPNGYDLFIQAGASLQPDGRDYEKLDRDALAAVVERNATALQLMRTGLVLQCQVSPKYMAPVPTGRKGSGADLGISAFRDLAEALVAEGRFAELDNRPADAAKSYLDAVRLGIASTQGGVLLHAMVGMTVESIGTRNLQRIVNQLDANSCRTISKALEELDSRRGTLKSFSEREHVIARQSPLSSRLAMMAGLGGTDVMLSTSEAQFNDRVATTRQLMVDLAARAYELETGRKAKNFANLVPGYLQAIPQNPITGTNMGFLPQSRRPAPTRD